MIEGNKKRRVKDDTPELWNKRKCAYCGKIFYSTPEWAYKLPWGSGERWFCKYSCKAAYEREKSPRRYTRIKA